MAEGKRRTAHTTLCHRARAQLLPSGDVG